MAYAYQMTGFETGGLGILASLIDDTTTEMVRTITRSGNFAMRVHRTVAPSFAATALPHPYSFAVPQPSLPAPAVGEDLKQLLRVYLYLPSYPSAEVMLVGIGNGTAVEKCSAALLVDGTGKFRVRITGTTGTLSATPIALNQWVKVTVAVLTQNTAGTDTTSATITVDGVAVTHTKTVTPAYIAPQVWFGDDRNSSELFDCYYDDVFLVVAVGTSPNGGDLPKVVEPTGTSIMPVLTTGMSAAVGWSGAYTDTVKVRPWPDQNYDVTDALTSVAVGSIATFTHRAADDAAVSGTIEAVNVVAQVYPNTLEVKLTWNGVSFIYEDADISVGGTSMWCFGGLALTTDQFDVAVPAVQYYADAFFGQSVQLAAVMLEVLAVEGLMPGFVMPDPKFTGFDDNGDPVPGGLLNAYAAGTSTPLDTYSDAQLTIPNTNPVELDSAGRAVVFVPDGVGYKFVLTTALGVIVWTQDNVSVPAIEPAPVAAEVPTGGILAYGASSAPSGYLLCDGSAVSRSTYAALFAIISTAYGVGNGTTTFNVPDFRGRFPMGVAAAGTGNTLGATGGTIDHVHTGPSHTHTIAAHTHTIAHTHNVGATAFGPFQSGVAAAFTNYVLLANAGGGGVDVSATAGATTGASSAANAGSTSLTTDASGTGNTGTANPPFLTAYFIIKT